jgi:predicted DNA-binding WGR domain protein
MPAKVNSMPLLQDGKYVVKKVVELNFFDLDGTKSKTKGTSNKSYHIECQVAMDGNSAQNFSMWGPTGGKQRKEWRHYSSEYAAMEDFNKIIKSKKKKGYVEVDVAQRAYGSEEAKKITKAVTLTNDTTKNGAKTTSLHPKVSSLVSKLFGSTNDFVITTLKCPLGQLTNNQVDLGRGLLQDANNILKASAKKKLTTKDKKDLATITNDFYAAIPHNFGTGFRGKMTHLILDDKVKIAQKEADLDTLMDAKAVGAVLTSNNIDKQYESLNADIEYLDPNEYDFSWIDSMIHGTRASNHHWLGKIKLRNVWKLSRMDEEQIFLKNAKKIAKECGKQTLPKKLAKYVKERPKLSNELFSLYKKSNVLPLCHGTRTENLIGITTSGFLIRPSGAVLTGAMYGNGIYFGFFSKAANYSSVKSSYWAKGGDDTGFVFVSDVALGKQEIANYSKHYTLNKIKPNHSVWAKGGAGGVINDEFIVYNAAGKNQQHCIRYLLEFSCKK